MFDWLRDSSTGANRRDFCRFDFPEGELDVQVGTGVVSPAQASVQNISRGGVLLALEEDPMDVTGIGHCVVRFLDKNNRLQPAAARGTIRRRGHRGPLVHLAIEFAEPLQSLGSVESVPLR